MGFRIHRPSRATIVVVVVADPRGGRAASSIATVVVASVSRRSRGTAAPVVQRIANPLDVVVGAEGGGCGAPPPPVPSSFFFPRRPAPRASSAASLERAADEPTEEARLARAGATEDDALQPQLGLTRMIMLLALLLMMMMMQLLLRRRRVATTPVAIAAVARRRRHASIDGDGFCLLPLLFATRLSAVCVAYNLRLLVITNYGSTNINWYVRIIVGGCWMISPPAMTLVMEMEKRAPDTVYNVG